MNINENDGNQDLQRENLLILSVWDGLSLGRTLHPSNKCSWVSVWLDNPFNAHLCHIKSQSVHPTPNKQRK